VAAPRPPIFTGLAGVAVFRRGGNTSIMSISDSPAETIGGTGLDASHVTATALTQALSAGTLTAAELTAFYLARIERLNPALRAVISASALAAAEAADSDTRRTAGHPRGPLEGMPVLIKDNVSVTGMPATAGSSALSAAGGGDAFLVGRLRDAGAVILGKRICRSGRTSARATPAAAGARSAARP
jgi:amidase